MKHLKQQLGALQPCDVLFFFIYSAFGVHSPFLPPLLKERGMEAAVIGVVLACATALKLVVSPLAGRVGDRYGALSITLAASMVGSAIASLFYISGAVGVALIAVVLAHAAFTGPIAPLSDAVGLRAVARNAALYGRMRGIGSAAFIGGILASGVLVSRFGLQAVFVANAALLAAGLAFAIRLRVSRGSPDARSGSFRRLLGVRTFRLAIAVSGLVLGSHALHDGFTMIRWSEAGIPASTAGLLWAISVAAEVLVFFFIGGPVLRALGPRGACLLASGAAIVRWSVMALTASPAVMALVQPLHGLTFALLHLACMQLIAGSVRPEHFGAAQGLYATLGAGVSSVLFTLLSGWLYGLWDAGAFWAMAALSASAIPVILLLPQAQAQAGERRDAEPWPR